MGCTADVVGEEQEEEHLCVVQTELLYKLRCIDEKWVVGWGEDMTAGEGVLLVVCEQSYMSVKEEHLSSDSKSPLLLSLLGRACGP